jgi:hypothetical protein
LSALSIAGLGIEVGGEVGGAVGAVADQAKGAVATAQNAVIESQIGPIQTSRRYGFAMSFLETLLVN